MTSVTEQGSKRILSIDVLRGLVMLIMALDHTRDFFHIEAMTGDPLNPDTTTGMLYFTRFITHFCAPTFVFLSGLSAYLSAQNKTPAQASKFLFKRGIWLIVVEIVLITLGITFNPFYNAIVLQVIWAIGFSMIFLALFSRISYKTVLVTGFLLVFGHNLFDLFPAPSNIYSDVLLKVFFTASGTIFPIGKEHIIADLYAVLPWTGIMFLGYGAGKWFKREYDVKKRKINLLNFGAAALVLFVALRIAGVYGDPIPRKEYHDVFKNLLSFFNVSKYPPSLQYTSLIIGVGLILLAVCEKFKNKLSKVFATYGSVPFFYYVIHFYLLHSILVVAFFASGYTKKDIINMPFMFRPNTFGFDLWGVYLIWIVVILALYYPCKWFKKYKETHSKWWLSYL
ncbi:hypothetical protein DHW03_02615 [Pedobacter yonginense]|uniref:Heparan-alpha-glucosaminide N-acetyltransferase catalytic domain-containing protein n=1 Tax=Pedobacter yonginense TaxID=651869 RepID=A0A317ESB3_9SPHI|nr:heparan-alpha-glucosaminide N-acetyltransferase domain-containing protein [Pedobacter yonginense]PWS28753.1 hypothetical protein DHW03_02615 [Pedobacter yonginense]